MADSPGEVLQKLQRRRTPGESLKTTFLSGLVVLAPVGLTFYVLHAIVQSADDLFDLLPEAQRPSELLFPGAGLLLALVVVLVAGFVARNVVGVFLLTWLSRGIERIPVVASLYRLLRQIAEAFLDTKGGKGFKRVVLVEWPRQEIWTFAFVTSELQGELAAAIGGRDGRLLNLFVPTTPNPTGGFHFIAHERDCVPTSLGVEEAFKMIISGGALLPDAAKGASVHRT